MILWISPWQDNVIAHMADIFDMSGINLTKILGAHKPGCVKILLLNTK